MEHVLRLQSAYRPKMMEKMDQIDFSNWKIELWHEVEGNVAYGTATEQWIVKVFQKNSASREPLMAISTMKDYTAREMMNQIVSRLVGEVLTDLRVLREIGR